MTDEYTKTSNAPAAKNENGSDSWWTYEDKPAAPVPAKEAATESAASEPAPAEGDTSIPPANASSVGQPAPAVTQTAQVEQPQQNSSAAANPVEAKPAEPSSLPTDGQLDFTPVHQHGVETGPVTPKLIEAEMAVRADGSAEPEAPDEPDAHESKFSIRRRLGKRPVQAVVPKPKKLQIPAVEISEALMLNMTNEVMKFSHIETSWGIWGIRYHADDKIVVCGMLYPTDNTMRSFGTTQFGNKEYVPQLHWLSSNYAIMQDKGLAPADTSLEFMFKGHSHHTLGLQRYSGTDIFSIKDAVLNDGMRIALGPLANIESNSSRVGTPEANGSCRVSYHGQVVFHFYYFSRMMVEDGFTEPVMIVPKIIKTSPIPALPMAWMYDNPAMFKDQIKGLRDVGCQVTSWALKEYDRLPLRIDFHVAKEGWKDPIVISTPYNWHPDKDGLAIYFDNEAKDPVVKTKLWSPVPRFYGTLAEVVSQLEHEGRLAGEVVSSGRNS